MGRGDYVRSAIFCAASLVTWSFVTLDKHQIIQHVFPSLPISLVISSLIIWVVSWGWPKYLKRGTAKYEAIPLDDLSQPWNGSTASDNYLANALPSALDAKTRRHLLFFIVSCLTIRINILGKVSQVFQCSSRGVESLLPLLLAIYDFMWVQRRMQTTDEEEDTFGNSIFEDISDALSKSTPRYIIPVSLLSGGAYLTATRATSTILICPIYLDSGHLISALQYAGVFFDAIIILLLWHLLQSYQDGFKRLRVVSIILASSTVAAVVFKGFLTIFDSELSGSYQVNWSFVYECTRDGLLGAGILICLCYVVPHLPPLTAIVILVFSCSFVSHLQGIFSKQSPFPMPYHAVNMLAMLMIFLGFTLYMRLASSSDSQSAVSFSRRVPGVLYGICIIFMIIAAFIHLLKNSTVGYHPVNLMMYNSRINHDRWLKQASSSDSLSNAVREYRTRYDREPPPMFDKWYEFARSHQSPIIDDYDRIMADLGPFWGLEPRELKRLTQELVTSGNPDILGLRIQGNNVQSMNSAPEDAQWIMDEMINMIKPFAQWLPDLEIAINIKGEPVGTTDWDHVQDLVRKGRQYKTELISDQDHSFSSTIMSEQEAQHDKAKRASRSNEIGVEPISRYAAAVSACPSSSNFRRTRLWNTRDMCARCAFPHSLGQFIMNWTLAFDICAQPDLVYLHEHFNVPDTTSIKSDLIIPIFSRSKLPGYSDILLPWPGDYTDRISTDPWPERTFDQMTNALFWRGDASAGIPDSSSWEQIHQQRLSHLVNKYTSKTLVPIIIPATTENRFIYRNIHALQLAKHIDINVAITGLDDCTGSACDFQKQQLGIEAPPNFDVHYNYRYLLTMDHKGPSSNFIPFLRSKSLPFKASIFREWYDDRITPWLHFIPQDVRFQGLHSTLAYFMGLKGNFDGEEFEMVDRTREAQFIADQGKRWAEKAIRKEDMEIYMFRLLLEWARLVDDRRYNIGFQV